MTGFEFATCYRLTPPAAGTLGIWCDEDGARIAGTVPLLTRDGSSNSPWQARPVAELDIVLNAGYGRIRDATAAHRGLQVVARALNDGNLAKAQIALLLLRLPDLPDHESLDRLARYETAIRLLKAGYDEDEPRRPKDTQGAGEWTGPDSGLPPKTHNGPPEKIAEEPKPVEVDPPRPAKITPDQALRMLWRSVRKLLNEGVAWDEAISTALRLVGRRVPLLAVFIASSIEPDPSEDEIRAQAERIMRERQGLEAEPKSIEDLYASGQDESFNSYREFRKIDDDGELDKRYGSAGDGQDWQHIVEQGAEGPGVNDRSINSTRNIVRIPHTIHEEITAEYNKKDPETHRSLRDSLKGKSFEEQYQEGLRMLRKHGVIK